MAYELPLEERSIDDIYLNSKEIATYRIPIYQRNYAWSEDEITTLVKDIYDSWQKNSSEPYYIGTLVTYKRGDKDFEVIDGQQRLTTIYIILNALGIKDIQNKLTYNARKISASTIERLEKYPDLGAEFDAGIKNGYDYALKALRNIVSEGERTAFIQYFLHQVRLIHYLVPKDVDLNHYFEVMNSRGEQLEKHEIAKSILSEKLDNSDRATFCHLWDCCSEMNVYVQQKFNRKEIFGSNWDSFQINSFSEIPAQDPAKDDAPTISELMQIPVDGPLQSNDDADKADKFQPIIDFPNFLLIVLKITRMEDGAFDSGKFTLDDKELLNEFKTALEASDNEKQFVQRFGFNLLKAKYLLDNYIVHHVLSDKESAGNNPWKLQYFYHDNPSKQYPKDLCTLKGVQQELVHLLSMFEVSFTPKQRKNYLFYCLLYLFQNPTASKEEYLQFLKNLARKYFYDVYLKRECLNDRNQPGPNAFDNAVLQCGGLNTELSNNDADNVVAFSQIYKQGKADIPLFVFNYTDYLLWDAYAKELRGKDTTPTTPSRVAFFAKLGCSDFKLEAFDSFYFSRTRKSLEHFYPQAKAVSNEDLTDNTISISKINCFGNFAMIGAEANSSGSNWDPKTKLDHYTDGKSDPVSVASLKFKIMLQMCHDNNLAMLNGELERPKGMEWNLEDMRKHQNHILEIMKGV